METLYRDDNNIVKSANGHTFFFDNSINLRSLNESSNIVNKAYVITRKPKQQGKIKISVGAKYSRYG